MSRPDSMVARLRELPRVDALADGLGVPHVLAVSAARRAIGEARTRILAGADADLTAVEARARTLVHEARRPGLRRVLNATGVIIHTNLGRAPLPLEAVTEALGYCNLELDLDTGRRGSRHASVAPLLVELSGAEAALAVNNCAAALVLALNALRELHGRTEIIISRGELVEIGGSFRIPEILETAGTRLREVGTTNRTRVADYERAVGPDTLAILRVHPSNFEMTGFVERPDTQALVELARKAAVPFIYDLGSDLLDDDTPLPRSAAASAPEVELDARTAIAAGADLVLFSGDKLLGGPQAGIALGRATLIGAMAKHPLMRALRMDKLGLAALEHVLRARLVGEPERVPALAMLRTSADTLGARARRLARTLEARGLTCELVPTADAVGGGSQPGATLPGVGLALVADVTGRPLRASALHRALRTGDLPVLAIIAEDRVVLALRTVPEADETALTEALFTALDIARTTL